MSKEAMQPNLAFGDFTIDREDERLIGPAGPLQIGHKAYLTLLALAESEGKLITKDALFTSVWDGTIVSEAALTSVVKELRRALGDDARAPRFIENVYGRGYRFLTPVRPAEPQPSRTAIAAEGAPSCCQTAGPAAVRPPLVLLSAFCDDAVRDRFPWCAVELREEILAGLSRFREIHLIDDDRPEEKAVQGRQHDRGYQLTATLLPDESGIKAFMRAKRMNDGRILWAETMSFSSSGMGGDVERIVRRIAGAVLPAVDEDMCLRLPPESDHFYDRYLRAKRISFTAMSFADAREAADILETIIHQHPDFAPAYPPLVRLYNTDFGYTSFGSTTDFERDRALELAQKGLAADQGNVHAYTVLGFCHLWHGQQDPAARCFERALVLNPYNPVRVVECATAWMFMDDIPRARSLMDQAFELNPTPGEDVYEDLARLRLLEGDHEGARAVLQSMVGGSIWASLLLSICELRLGLDSGLPRLAAWRERVERNWRDASLPDADTICRWIYRHHPFTESAARRCFHGLYDAVLQMDKPTSRSVPTTAAGTRQAKATAPHTQSSR